MPADLSRLKVEIDEACVLYAAYCLELGYDRWAEFFAVSCPITDRLTRDVLDGGNYAGDSPGRLRYKAYNDILTEISNAVARARLAADHDSWMANQKWGGD